MSTFRHVGETDKEPYHYTQCGLDDVYLMSGYEVEHEDGEEWFSVKHMDELHRAIGRALAAEKKELSGKEVRFLRKEMDLTQAELGRLVGLSDQAVARWEKGQTEMPRPAEYLLRYIYLQYLDEQIDVAELVNTLTEADSRCDRLVFQEDHGWKQCA